jgi:hypothetical protein
MIRSLLLVTLVLALSTVASASPKVAPPAALVRGHTVSHAPTGLTIHVPRTATFVGKERFDLKGVADAEIELFVEADKNKRVTRLYWIQFEHPWPSEKWRYDYTGDRREHHWGTTVWINSGPGSTTRTADPRSDTAHMRAMLQRAGYTAPPEMMNVRIIQLLDDPKGTGHGGQEVMFIYAEDLAKTGKTLAHWEKAPDAEWSPVGKALVARATKAFEVIRR